MKSRMKVKTIVNLLIALTYIVSPTLIFATNEVETFERKVVVEKALPLGANIARVALSVSAQCMKSIPTIS